MGEEALTGIRSPRRYPPLRHHSQSVVEPEHMNKPYEPTAQEREEVAAVRVVQEGFGLEDEEDPAAWLMEYPYGAMSAQTD